ncbi:MAG TPA: ATP-binding cassette domain-containing protein [Methylomirabilota bacterium]|nr:ATP-binding cassette domain-containing protein [Methylomirabilota bacterium]
MIELLGVGVPRPGGGWLLHRVCASLEAGELTLIVSGNPDERLALLDTICGRRVPDEGRVWVSRVPLMDMTVGRIRALCAEVDASSPLIERRSLFWNALAPATGPRTLGGLLRLPRRRERELAVAALERVGLRARTGERISSLSAFDRMRFLVARALAQRSQFLVVREPDRLLGGDGVGSLLALLRLLTREERLGVVVSLAAADAGHAFADRALVLDDGLLLFHGRVDALTGARAARHAGILPT